MYNECPSASDVSLKILQTGHSLFTWKSFPITANQYLFGTIAANPFSRGLLFKSTSSTWTDLKGTVLLSTASVHPSVHLSVFSQPNNKSHCQSKVSMWLLAGDVSYYNWISYRKNVLSDRYSGIQRNATINLHTQWNPTGNKDNSTDVVNLFSIINITDSQIVLLLVLTDYKSNSEHL